MKLQKENGMLDLDLLDEICWHLKMSDIERLKCPTDSEGKCLIHPMVWRKNKHNVKMLKQTLQYVMDNAYSQEYFYKKIDGKDCTINKLNANIDTLAKEKEQLESEVKTLKDKIQEAQVTAGLFIQSVKDKLPNWFTKDKENS